MQNHIPTEHRALAQKLEIALLEAHGDVDASHDVHHSRRVCANALHIAKLEKAGDDRVLIAAAFLHDIINVPKNSPDRDKASTLSAKAARPLLFNLGFSDHEIDATAHCIEAHSFSANIAPTTIDAKILQDADRLESLGALGIARTFYIACKLESDLFNGADPFAVNRDLDDKKYAVDHFRIKLLGLADTMQTSSGKQLALQRTDGMRTFLNQLASELYVEQPW